MIDLFVDMQDTSKYGIRGLKMFILKTDRHILLTKIQITQELKNENRYKEHLGNDTSCNKVEKYNM